MSKKWAVVVFLSDEDIETQEQVIEVVKETLETVFDSVLGVVPFTKKEEEKEHG